MHTSSKSGSRFPKFSQSPGSYRFLINSHTRNINFRTLPSRARLSRFGQSPGSKHVPINPFTKKWLLGSRLPDPDFKDFARDLEAIIFLLIPAWLSDPYFQDLCIPFDLVNLIKLIKSIYLYNRFNPISSIWRTCRNLGNLHLWAKPLKLLF